MYTRIFLVSAVMGIMVVLSGCGKAVENFSYTETVPSPIPLTCTEDTDCMLTEQLYDPCGSVHSIHVNTPQSIIDGHNQVQMELNSGIQYDCDIPPSVHDYVSMCRKQVCVSAKKQ